MFAVIVILLVLWFIYFGLRKVRQRKLSAPQPDSCTEVEQQPPQNVFGPPVWYCGTCGRTNSGDKPCSHIWKRDSFLMEEPDRFTYPSRYSWSCGRRIVLDDNQASPYEQREARARHISAEVRRHVWKRDNQQCVECGSRNNLEMDHAIPFSRGGSNSIANIRLLCQQCNRTKHSKI